MSRQDPVPNVGRVYLGLFGPEFDPDTLDVGIRPTETRRRGDSFPPHSSWIISTDKVISNVLDIGPMASALIHSLLPHEARIVTAMQAHKLEAVLQVVLTISPDESVSEPAVGFESSILSFMGRLGGAIDIDIYRGSA